MSLDNVKKFEKDFEENEELREKVEKELEALKDSGKDKKELIPEVARKLGYEFTDFEFKENLSKAKALTDDEIEKVTGGKGEGKGVAEFIAWVMCGFNHHYVPTGKTTVKYDVVFEAEFYEVKCVDCGHKRWERGTPPDIKGPKINPNIDVVPKE